MDGNVKEPLLTIGIPTFNRAGYLDSCLGALCGEAGNLEEVEILICDNCSTDNTEEVARKYERVYSNVRYIKQSENLGFDKNLKTIFDLGKGKYIKPHGDDDFFNAGSIREILNIVQEYEDIDLFFIHLNLGMRVEVGYGFNDYLAKLRSSNGITFITSIIIKKSAYDKIEEKDRYLDSKIYQLYLEMEVLKNNPKYCLIGGMVSGLSGRAERRFYNIGEVFIQNYFDIVGEYEKYGLAKLTISAEKYHVLYMIIRPLSYISNVMEGGIRKDNLLDIYNKYYKDEVFYLNGLAVINSCL